MKLAVVGLWHLGCVTAACMAKLGYQVIAYDAQSEVIANLNQQKPPIFEPGLKELLQEGLTQKKLHFTSHAELLSDADIIWVTFDTPVDDNDQANVNFVLQGIKAIYPHIKNDALIILSSQIPLGTTDHWQQLLAANHPDKSIQFAYLPENLRLGKALEIFLRPDRIIAGVPNDTVKKKISELLAPLASPIIWMSVKSAEMSKHALNSFLAVSVTFINEIASMCEKTGANAYEVEQALKSEARIGPRAYLKPGSAIAGGTLLRDIQFVKSLAIQVAHPAHLFSAILDSNLYHQHWLYRKILEVMEVRGSPSRSTITVLGLAYKANTDTLRRSLMVSICEQVAQHGIQIKAYDPFITALPESLASIIQFKTDLQEALSDSHALIIGTDSPQFHTIPFETFKHIPVIDPNGIFHDKLKGNVNYYSVGKSS